MSEEEDLSTLTLRFDKETLNTIDDLRARRRPILSRSEMIRKLVKIGIENFKCETFHTEGKD